MSLRIDSSYPPANGSAYYSRYIHGQITTALVRLDWARSCLNDAGMQLATKIEKAQGFLNEARNFLSADNERNSDQYRECQQLIENLQQEITTMQNLVPPTVSNVNE